MTEANVTGASLAHGHNERTGPLLPPAATPAWPASLSWPNRFHALGTAFHTELAAQAMPAPHWVARSEACAAELGFPADWADPSHAALDVFSGNATWPGMRPLASVYSGHQFGVWAGQLGDGRALWLGEVDTPHGPRELQLKGAGRTPYSRGGDGRAVLRSSIREFLCSEAMHGLGIATTRALCVTGSALPVRRETLETAAVVTRVAPSFIRFGHFEHFAANQRIDELRRLADFVVAQHLPDCHDAPQPYAALLAEATRRTARLMAQWQSVGFCHGVMNTDNLSILGLTLDYGPFGFLDAYDPGHVCNHSDTQGRYAFARQPQVAYWNLHALAQALLPLIGDSDAALAALEPYANAFNAAAAALTRAKLGLATAQPGDGALAEGWLALLAADRVDHTIAWRRLASFDSAAGATRHSVRDLFIDRPAFDAWAERYAERLRAEHSVDAERASAMNRANPKVVLRNHLAEEAIQAAQQGDFSVTERLLAVLQSPFDEHPEAEAMAGFPPAWAQQLEVSCSS